ncbi:MAG: hypothetical protein K0R17_122 [Rariglobus sp.]|jgi:hypothetical protein|nr:hypothetical protein [Rariglobus sp.]
MKLNSALAKSLLMAASIGMIVPMAAQTAPKPAKPAPAPAPTEEPAKVEGLELPRKNGGFLGLTINGAQMTLKFYDAEKKSVAVDVARAAARWDPVNKATDVRTVLNPSADGQSLVSPSVVQPPLVFKVYLTLIAADGTAVESIIADLRELEKAKK